MYRDKRGRSRVALEKAVYAFVESAHCGATASALSYRDEEQLRR
jgi:hypothetical protein